MLRWNQDWSHVREHWDQQLELGRPVPPPFLDEPEILLQHRFYFTAFCDLGTERSFGMGIGPIPVSKAREYANSFGLSDDEWDKFWSIIREVDADFLTMINKKNEKNKPVAASDSAGMKSQMERIKERSLRR